MKAKDEKEIDETVIAQAEDENAWIEIQLVKNRAKRGSHEKFLKALRKVPKVEPEQEDKIE